MVSIVIPTFNRCQSVLEAVSSVLRQTFTDLELIVVDDGSTDDTLLALGRLEDPRLRLVPQIRSGVSRARNRGIDSARFPWIAFLDSDDLWKPEKLERQLEVVRANPEYQIVYTDEIWIRRGLRVNPRKVHRKYSGWIYEYCLPRCIVSPSSVMLHRRMLDCYGRFDEALPVCEDYDLWLRLSAFKPFFFMEEPLIVKRGGHEDQLSKSTWGFDRFRVEALCKILKLKALTPRLQKLTALEIASKCRILRSGCLKRGRDDEAQKFQGTLTRALQVVQDLQ